MLGILDGFDLVVDSMFQRPKHTGHSFLSPRLFYDMSGPNCLRKGQS